MAQIYTCRQNTRKKNTFKKSLKKLKIKHLRAKQTHSVRFSESYKARHVSACRLWANNSSLEPRVTDRCPQRHSASSHSPHPPCSTAAHLSGIVLQQVPSLSHDSFAYITWEGFLRGKERNRESSEHNHPMNPSYPTPTALP